MKIEIEHEGSTPVNVGRRKVVSFARRLTRRHLRRGVRGVGHVRVGWLCFPEIGGPRSGEPHSGGPQQGEPPQAAPSAQTCAPVPASVSCAVILTRLPARRMEPSSTERTPRSRPTAVFLPRPVVLIFCVKSKRPYIIAEMN